MELITKLKNKDGFTEREIELADYILNHCESILNMTTRELASQTYTSATVIVRFTKKLGYQGFNDFKLHLLSDLKENSYQEIEIEKEENLISTVNKVSSLHELVLLETKNNLSINDLEQIQQALKKNHQVDIFAIDANASIGEYISHHIMQAGKICNVYKSIDKILLYESLVKDSVVIIISRMGLNEHVLTAVRNLKAKGHFIILITSNKNSLFVKNSDVVLLCTYKEDIMSLGDSLFHTSVSFLLNIIVSIIVKNNYDKVNELYDLHGELYNS